MGKAMIYISIFFLGFVLVSLWSFWLAIRPPKLTLGYTPKDFGLAAEELEVAAPDGIKLSAWFIPGHTARALVFLHGYPAEKSDMLSLAAPFAPEFSLLLLDLRYFGKSGGAYTTLGIKERDDLKSALDVLERKGVETIGIFGFSLGGATAILAAAEDRRVDAIATYAAFSNLRTLGYEAYRTLGPLKYPLIFLMELWAHLFFGESPVAVTPESAAAKLSIPVLVIHTKGDEQVSFAHAERLKRALAHNPSAEFYLPDRGRHGEIDFSSRLKEFFEKSLQIQNAP